MFIDVVKYLQQIPKESWTVGNESVFAFKDGHFIKCLKAKAPNRVHNLFTTNKLNNTLQSYTPMFEMYYYLNDADLRLLSNVEWNVGMYRHVYVFAKVSFLDLKLFYNKHESKDTMPVLDDLQLFLSELDKEKVVYQDACWANIGCNKTTGKLCVIDVDSMIDANDTYKNVKGSPLFHTSFLQFSRQYPRSLQDLKWLNLCTFHNMLFAFVIGLALNNTDYTFMKYKSAVNEVVTKYINGNYTDEVSTPSTYKLKLDDDSTKVLKSATSIVKMCIEGKYVGLDPYEDMATLARDLIAKYPTVRVPQQVPAAPNIPSASATPSTNAASSAWSKHAGRNTSNLYASRTPTPSGSSTKYTPPPPLSRMSKSRGGPNVLLTLAHAMTVLTILMMLINVFMPHGTTVDANNTTNNTTINTTMIPIANTTSMQNSSVVSVTSGNMSDLQTYNVSAENSTLNNTLHPITYSTPITYINNTTVNYSAPSAMTYVENSIPAIVTNVSANNSNTTVLSFNNTGDFLLSMIALPRSYHQ